MIVKKERSLTNSSVEWKIQLCTVLCYIEAFCVGNLFFALTVLICLQTIFLPVVGLVDPDTLKPGDLVGVNKDSYLILDTLPSEYDSRVKAMEVDEKPTEDYGDIGGLEKQVILALDVPKHLNT